MKIGARGMSLVEMAVGMGIAALGVVATMSVVEQTSRSQKSLSLHNEMTSVRSRVATLLRDEGRCASNLVIGSRPGLALNLLPDTGFVRLDPTAPVQVQATSAGNGRSAGFAIRDRSQLTPAELKMSPLLYDVRIEGARSTSASPIDGFYQFQGDLVIHVTKNENGATQTSLGARTAEIRLPIRLKTNASTKTLVACATSMPEQGRVLASGRTSVDCQAAGGSPMPLGGATYCMFESEDGGFAPDLCPTGWSDANQAGQPSGYISCRPSNPTPTKFDCIPPWSKDIKFASGKWWAYCSITRSVTQPEFEECPALPNTNGSFLVVDRVNDGMPKDSGCSYVGEWPTAPLWYNYYPYGCPVTPIQKTGRSPYYPYADVQYWVCPAHYDCTTNCGHEIPANCMADIYSGQAQPLARGTDHFGWIMIPRPNDSRDEVGCAFYPPCPDHCDPAVTGRPCPYDPWQIKKWQRIRGSWQYVDAYKAVSGAADPSNISRAYTYPQMIDVCTRQARTPSLAQCPPPFVEVERTQSGVICQ